MAERRIKYFSQLIDDRPPAERAADGDTKQILGYVEADGVTYTADTLAAIQAKRDQGWPDFSLQIRVMGTSSQTSALFLAPASSFNLVPGAAGIVAQQAAQLTAPSSGLTLAGGSVTITAMQQGAPTGANLTAPSSSLTLAAGSVTLTAQAQAALVAPTNSFTLAPGVVMITAMLGAEPNDAALVAPASVLTLAGGPVALVAQQAAALVAPASALSLAGGSVTLVAQQQQALTAPASTLALASGVVAITAQKQAALTSPSGSLLLASGSVTITAQKKANLTAPSGTLSLAGGVVAITATVSAGVDDGSTGWTLTNSGNFADANLDTYENADLTGGNPLPYYFTNHEGIVDPNIGVFWIEMSKSITIRTGDTISATLGTSSDQGAAASNFSGYLSINGNHVLTWTGAADSGVTKSISSNAYAGAKTVVIHAQYDTGGNTHCEITSVSIPK